MVESAPVLSGTMSATAIRETSSGFAGLSLPFQTSSLPLPCETTSLYFCCHYWGMTQTLEASIARSLQLPGHTHSAITDTSSVLVYVLVSNL